MDRDPPLAPVELAACAGAHLFIDAGSNLGEGVDALFSGALYRCALHSPNRLYGAWWQTASAQARASAMSTLATPKKWCTRSFEANPRLLPALRERERTERQQGLNVRYVDGLLGTATSARAPRTIVTYSNDTAGSAATYFAWREIFFTSSPPNLGERVETGASFDLRQVVAEALRLQPHAKIALRLDVEGAEFPLLDALLTPPPGAPRAAPPLLCNVSFLFVEYHNLHARMAKYGLPANDSAKDGHMLAYQWLGGRIQAVMDTPGCRLRIHWRNFWSACGEPARYSWMGSKQATGLERPPKQGGRRRRGRRRGRQ